MKRREAWLTGRVKLDKIMSGLHMGAATHPSSVVILPMTVAYRTVRRNFGLSIGLPRTPRAVHMDWPLTNMPVGARRTRRLMLPRVGVWRAPLFELWRVALEGSPRSHSLARGRLGGGWNVRRTWVVPPRPDPT